MKKRIRSIFGLILVICLCVALCAGCGGDSDDGGSSKKKSDKESSSESKKDSDKKSDKDSDKKDKDEDSGKEKDSDKDNDKDTDKDNDKDKDDDGKDNKASAYAIDNQVIYDDENVSFTVVNAEDDEFWGFALKVLCENKTEETKVRFSIDDVTVNGYLCDPYWSTDVPAGKKTNATIYFNTDRFEDMGIKAPDEIKFTLRAYDSDSWMDEYLVYETFSIYPTGLSADQVVVPERRTTATEFVVVDDALGKFIILDAEMDEFWGYTVNVYLENNSDKRLRFGLDDVTVNGFVIDPYWAVNLAPGMKAYSEISFSESHLSDNGITKVEEIEYTVSVEDADDWMADPLFEATQVYKP